MKRFTELFLELDATTATSEKTAALVRYFSEADPRDAAWALEALSGNKIIRAISSRRVRPWLSEETDLPAWLISECYSVVGDFSETLSLLLPEPKGDPFDEPLHKVVEERLLPLARLDEDAQKKLITDVWRRMTRDERFVFQKLFSASFRVGVSAKLVARALAEVAGVEPAVMAHRLMGKRQLSAESFRKLLAPEGNDDRKGRPYPFFLASPIAEVAGSMDALGDARDWAFEWKWDGIRAQLIKRDGEVALWSRGEELVTNAFPEIVAAGAELQGDAVLDGELLAWEDGQPLPFSVLQRRINRKSVEPSLFPDVPVAMLVYDALERDGQDLREHPLDERRAVLEELIPGDPPLLASPRVEINDWDHARELVAGARERGVEGLMVKRRSSPYSVGRTRGDWWKWKVDPLSVDAVMVQAQTGSGKRAGLFTDYTFAVWDGEDLTPVAKAYSGLTNQEIEEVDRWVRASTITRHGPVRVVKPEQVFELHFEGIAASDRHKSGIAVRFPRMARWRRDKKPKDADTLDNMRALLERYER